MTVLAQWLRTRRGAGPLSRPLVERTLPLESAAPCERPLFISGCNRGGTSILSQLLGSHPELWNVGEGRLHEGQVWNQRFQDESRHRWAVEPWRSQMRKTAADACPFQFSTKVAVRGRLLEKNPSNSMRIAFIIECFPDAGFIHILRDGRDTACSLVARKVPFEVAPLQWVGAHTTALADLERLPPQRVYAVRYEELLADPIPVLLRISRHFGLAVGSEVEAIFSRAATTSLRTPVARWPHVPPGQKSYAISIIRDPQLHFGYGLD